MKAGSKMKLALIMYWKPLCAAILVVSAVFVNQEVTIKSSAQTSRAIARDVAAKTAVVSSDKVVSQIKIEAENIKRSVEKVQAQQEVHDKLLKRGLYNQDRTMQTTGLHPVSPPPGWTPDKVKP